MSTERIRKTLRAYQRAVTADPTDVDLRQKLASYLAALGYTRQAAQELELCAKLLAARGELVRAIACGKRLLKLDPGRTDILLFLTRHYAERGPHTLAAHGDDDRLSAPERVARALAPRPDRDLTPAVPSRAIDHDAPDSDRADLASATHRAALAPHEAATRVVRMPNRDPGLESIELTMVSLGGDDDLPLEGLTDDLDQDAPHHQDASAAAEHELDGAPPHLVRVEVPNAAPLDIRPSQMPGIPLFSSLEPDAFMGLLEGLEQRTLTAGLLLDGRDPGASTSAVEILVHGRLHAFWQRDDGARVDLGPLSPGSLIDLGADSEHGRLVIDVLEESEVLVLPRTRLDALALGHPAIRHKLASLHHKRLVRDFLAASNLFDALGPSDRELLARRLRPRVLRPGEWLGHRGEPTHGLYLVREGQLESLGPDGDRIAVLGAGHFFGIHSLHRGAVFLTDLRALVPTTLLVLAAHDLELFLEAHPEARAAFADIAARQPLVPVSDA